MPFNVNVTGDFMKTYTIRPGLLVGLSTSMTGNVRYKKTDAGVLREDGAELATWTTERMIANKAEHEAAKVLRSQAVYAVRKVCAVTGGGHYLCPQERAGELAAAIATAEAMVADFNKTAKTTRLAFSAMVGEFAAGDSVTSRAIAAEVNALRSAMADGLRDGDVAAMRSAADRAKAIAGLLGDADRATVEGLVAKVRSEARRMVKGGDAPSVAAEAAAVEAAPEPEPVAMPEPTAEVEPTMSATEAALAALRKRKQDARRARA